MTHLALSPAKNARAFTPLTKSFDRTGKDGAIPQINYLIGSQYNVKIDGNLAITSVGDITADTAKAVAGKLEIAGQLVTGALVEKIASYTSFMYFYPGLKIVGNSEVQDADVGSGPIPIQRIRHVYEDLSTTDQIIIDFQGGDGNAQLVFSEKVSGVTTILVTKEITVGVKNVKWELDFQEDGVTKFWYKEPSGTRTRIFNGVLDAEMGESKVSVKLMLDQTSTKTVKSDFMLIYYPNINIGYDVAIADRLQGRIKVFDTNNSVPESGWIEVFSGDHEFVEDRVIENGFIRLRFKTTPEMQVFGWSVTAGAWELASSVIPKNTQGDLATTLQDIIFRIYNDSSVKLNVKYGIVDHVVEIKRGQPYARICTTSKEFRVAMTARRFALSTDVNTDIPDFNQENTDDTNRGNPLNLSPANNPFIFTNDSNVNTGLLLLDDNWFGWYDENDSNNMVGWMAVSKRCTGLIITATSPTALEKAEWTFDANAIITVGILESDPTSVISGVPLPFHIGDPDAYVKFRANESLYGFNQKGFLRRKR